MNRNNLVINTLVYLNDIERGKKQDKLLYDIKDLGVLNAEVRREYIKTDHDLLEIARVAQELGVNLFYSIPDTLFKNQRLDIWSFRKYIDEAKILNAQIVKFNKGDYQTWYEEDVQAFSEITSSYKGLVTVENDQTEENGKMKTLLPFYQECQRKNIPIYATFDMGNSLWVNEVPKDNAMKVKDYTRYVHIKDVIKKELRATYLGAGDLPWKDILQSFSNDLFYAIEYPCGDQPNVALKMEIEKLLD